MCDLVFVADYWRRGAVLTARHRCRNDPGAFRELIMFRICVILRFGDHSWEIRLFLVWGERLAMAGPVRISRIIVAMIGHSYRAVQWGR